MDPENLASQKVAQKIGMSLERKVDGIAGDNFPTFIYSIHKVKP
jgi:RimJ/RimL family protein N-acetyltransferase